MDQLDVETGGQESGQSLSLQDLLVLLNQHSKARVGEFLDKVSKEWLVKPQA